MPTQPAFLVHTGDISHLSKEEEWDDADQIIKGANKEVFYIPGEHDVADADNGKAYSTRYGKKTQGKGWYSFDTAGVHFIALVNVFDFNPASNPPASPRSATSSSNGWRSDVEAAFGEHADRRARPFAAVDDLPAMGLGHEDAARALGYLKRFGSVTVLNGHIHQIMQKVEGNVTFHTALCTAFPQPAPGAAPAPGPMKVPPEQLPKHIGAP